MKSSTCNRQALLGSEFAYEGVVVVKSWSVMMSTTTVFRSKLLAVAAALAGAAGVASAGPLAQYGGPAINKYTAGACLALGDAVSCSAGMLNVLNGLSGTQKTTDATKGYVYAAPQGGLKDSIVIGAGGAAALGNGDTNPTVGKVEDGFKTNASNDKYLATGKTSQVAGNLGDPANNALRPDAERVGTWDVELGWLRDALTVQNKRHELMIGFDYNQSQGQAGSVSYWALVTLRDLDGNKLDINFEIGKDISANPLDALTFSSTKTIDSKPNSSDFGVVNTVTCFNYLPNSTTVNPLSITPMITGNCAGFDGKVENAQSTSTTEILAFLPELDSNLESYIAAGYDSMSVRMLFGCFDNSSTDRTIGQGYLADTGSTAYCDLGGNTDIFLLAGAEREGTSVPEPSGLALVGLALGLIGWMRRRVVS